MRRINKPGEEIDINVILDNALLSMSSPRKEHVEAVKDTLVLRNREYDALAEVGQLYTINEHYDVDGIATEDDMRALYEQKFVPQNALNRMYYDAIKQLAKGICPYCNQNKVDTLDHFLPKSKYVSYAVAPYNLVPACFACNKNKSTSTFSSYNNQSFHPYYDDFNSDIWLKAKLIQNKEISFQFYAEPPESFSSIIAERITNSFSKELGFGLNDIYRIHAGEIYQACEHRLKILFDKGGKDLAIARLVENIEDERSVNMNSWKAAIYKAIIDCDWYWDEYITEI